MGTALDICLFADRKWKEKKNFLLNHLWTCVRSSRLWTLKMERFTRMCGKNRYWVPRVIFYLDLGLCLQQTLSCKSATLLSPVKLIKWTVFLLTSSLPSVSLFSWYNHNWVTPVLSHGQVSFPASKVSIFFLSSFPPLLLEYTFLKMKSWLSYSITGEGDGTPLQHSCLENPMDGGAWEAAVHGVVKS